MPEGGSVVELGGGEGIGLGQQPVVHGVRPEPAGERVRPHDLGRDRQGDAVLGQPAGGVLGGVELADAAVGILQRRLHRVPAVEDDVAGCERGAAMGRGSTALVVTRPACFAGPVTGSRSMGAPLAHERPRRIL